MYLFSWSVYSLSFLTKIKPVEDHVIWALISYITPIISKYSVDIQ